MGRLDFDGWVASRWSSQSRVGPGLRQCEVHLRPANRAARALTSLPLGRFRRAGSALEASTHEQSSIASVAVSEPRPVAAYRVAGEATWQTARSLRQGEDHLSGIPRFGSEPRQNRSSAMKGSGGMRSRVRRRAPVRFCWKRRHDMGSLTDICSSCSSPQVSA